MGKGTGSQGHELCQGAEGEFVGAQVSTVGSTRTGHAIVLGSPGGALRAAQPWVSVLAGCQASQGRRNHKLL